MTTSQERLLYEISLAISPTGTLEETAKQALEAYLEQLDCDVGAVLERTEDPTGVCYETVVSVPVDPASDPVLDTAISAVTDSQTNTEDSDCDSEYPLSGSLDGDRTYQVLSLPGFGALVLGTDGRELGDGLIEALEPLNQKLAESCCSKQAEAKLREERNRFEAVFETIQEPLVHVVYRDGKPIVTRLNPAFEETFGYDREEVLGENINEIIVPDDDQLKEEAKDLDSSAQQGQRMTKEIRRKTKDGIGDFLFRGAPVEAIEKREHFAMYIDITEEKNRQRKLERLYDETEEMFAGNRPQEVCEQTIEAASEIVPLEFAGVYLYDRSQTGLVPAAITGDIEEVFDETPVPYTDRDTVVWDVYESGEPVLIEDTDAFEGTLPNGDTPMGSAMLLSLGSHGVFISSSLEKHAFDETDLYFGRLLSTLVETALNRAQRVKGLEGIQEITRETLTAETHREVTDIVLERIPEVFDLPVSGVWEYDDGQNVLQPVDSTEQAKELIGEMPTFQPGSSVAWNCYQNGEMEVIADISEHPEAYNEDSVLGSEICVPIGDFGVLATGSTDKESFSQSEQSLIETLGANLETTMRLINRRREMELLDQVLARILRHNIRNDLTIIQGFATEIENDFPDASVHTQRIIDRCESLRSTAKHAREIRHIVTNREQREQLHLQDVVESVRRELEDEYPDVEITTSFESDPEMVAHPDLPVAVRHLIENGIEHNTGSPEIDISVFQDSGKISLQVSDNGPGIPDHEVEVLDRHGESALEHGSGAGLWIVDRVADYSDGTVNFEATETGTVATMSFELG